ncbi:MAG: hypothetical protein ACREM1_12725, partial [Longimicrobiales bacterium]
VMRTETSCAQNDWCESGYAERPRYYARQIITPDDLTLGLDYLLKLQRRHNRLLHGWGVVCGACVRRGSGACDVIVEPGYILGPWGDEIVIPDEVTVDVCRASRREQVGCCEPDPLDPWCDDGPPDCPRGTMYLAIRYAECKSRPVRALQSGCGCGCDESACEYSRIRDGYAIAVLPELPPTYTTPLGQPTFGALIPPCRGQLRQARSCPPCPESPWVILADIAVDPRCRVLGVDCFAHRRHVVSFATFYFACGPSALVPQPAQPAEPGRFAIARTIAALSGSSDLIDVDVPAGTPPRATVAMTRGDGTTVSVPAFFEVRGGETLAELLEREGGRSFYDPVTRETVTLRELYTAAGVPSDATLTGATSALAPLEGRTLDVGSVREDRAALAELLTPEALERLDRELGGRAEGAADLPATALVGVAPRSTLGRFVTDLSIADTATRPRDEFIAAAGQAASASRRRDVETQAAELWDAARRIYALRR